MASINFIDLHENLVISQEEQTKKGTTRTTLNEKFNVPYQRNVNFTGRKTLLAALHAKLRDIVPGTWNH